MKKIISVLLLTLLFGTVFAQTGYDIMKKADEVPTAKTSSYTATMTLTDKKGNVRVREVKEMTKDFEDVSKSVIIFTTPKDVAGVGYLMFDYVEKSDGTKQDSDNWLYMPALKKVRRISGSDSGGDFMGTDFTYEDMGDRGLNKDTFTLLGEENVDGTDCYKVEAVSKDNTEKKSSSHFVDWKRKLHYVQSRILRQTKQSSKSFNLFRYSKN